LGLDGSTPILARVNNVNKVMYLEDLYLTSRFPGVKVEVLSLDFKSLTLTFRGVKRVERVEADTLVSIEFNGGGLVASRDQGIYIIDSYGGLKVKAFSELSGSEVLVSIVKSRFESVRDEFRYLSRGKAVRGRLLGSLCNSHELSDLSPSKLVVFSAMLRSFVESFVETGSQTRRIEGRRATSCFKDHLRAYELSWSSRLQGFPSVIVRDGSSLCVKVTHGGGRSRDMTEKLPLEPMLKLKRVLRKHMQSEAVRHILGHSKMKFISKRVAAMAVMHLLCGGLPRGLEGLPGLVLRNMALLAFSDLVAVRLAEVKVFSGKRHVYVVEVEDGEAFFAGPIPILLSVKGAS